MNTNLYPKTIYMGVLLALPFLTGCQNTFPLYSKYEVEQILEKREKPVFDEGRHHEVRLAEEQRLAELAKPKPKERYYNIQVPDHVNEHGIQIDSYTQPIKIIE